VAVGLAVGLGVAVAVGLGVGVALDIGVGVALGLGVGVGVGAPDTTITVPTMPQHAPCTVQKYGNVPTLLKVWVKAPWLRIPESQIPFGIPGEPDVVLWSGEPQLHFTLSPG